MSDLIGGYERLRYVYQQYVESAFPLRSEALTQERSDLLRRVGAAETPGILAQPPLLEPVRRRRSSPSTPWA
jgi:hypothetical protein